MRPAPPPLHSAEDGRGPTTPASVPSGRVVGE